LNLYVTLMREIRPAEKIEGCFKSWRLSLMKSVVENKRNRAVKSRPKRTPRASRRGHRLLEMRNAFFIFSLLHVAQSEGPMRVVEVRLQFHGLL